MSKLVFPSPITSFNLSLLNRFLKEIKGAFVSALEKIDFMLKESRDFVLEI